MKNKKFYKIALLSSAALLPNAAILCSCNKKTADPEIKAPLVVDSQVGLKRDQKDIDVWFYGFQFNNISDAKSLSVTTNFALEGATIDVSIEDFDLSTRTFNVKLSLKNCKPIDKITGNFIFKINGAEIKFDSTDFSISIYEYVAINKPSVISTKCQFEGIAAVAKFTGFSYLGVLNPDVVQCKFKTDSLVNTTCKIENLNTTNKTFDLYITVKGARATDIVQGKLEFYIGETILDYDYPETTYTISFTTQKVIIEPKNKHQNGFYSGSAMSVSFPDFYFSGINTPDEITVSAEFANAEKPTEVKKLEGVSITDFDISKQKFSVTIPNLDKSYLGDWVGKFTFKSKVDKEKTILETEQMSFSLYYVIPQDKLNIVEEVEQATGKNYTFLKGLNDTSISDYNALLIPSIVEKISANAFENIFQSGAVGQTIKYLFFEENNYLTHIGDSAFSNCNSLIGDVKIPDTVQSIGESAFAGCTSLNGTLSMPFNPTNEIKISNKAFQNCKFTHLDLQEYAKGYVPSWGSKYETENLPFSGWDTSETNTIIVCKDNYETEYCKTLLAYLKTLGFPDNWTFVSA